MSCGAAAKGMPHTRETDGEEDSPLKPDHGTLSIEKSTQDGEQKSTFGHASLELQEVKDKAKVLKEAPK